MRRRCTLLRFPRNKPSTPFLTPFFTTPFNTTAKTSSGCLLIDGAAIAKNVRKDVAAEVSKMKSLIGKVPGLAVIHVGAQSDSMTYVLNKKTACEEVGISSFCVELPENSHEDSILATVEKFNDDVAVHGILVQLPLPKHINEEKILNAISIEKDVDGLHPMNMGSLALRGNNPLFIPCSASACIELLLSAGVRITGKHVIVIGRSNIAGLPISLLLQKHNATVTVIQSSTKEPEKYVHAGDIIIAAARCPNLVRGHWLKPGAVVIDVGINYMESSTKGEVEVVGDVCFEEACKVASAITPVPGGVGPMTIAMLLCNTLKSAKLAFQL